MPNTAEPATVVRKEPAQRPQGFSSEVFLEHAKAYAHLLQEASQISKRILETPFTVATNPQQFAADTIRFSQLGQEACQALGLLVMLTTDSEGEG